MGNIPSHISEVNIEDLVKHLQLDMESHNDSALLNSMFAGGRCKPSDDMYVIDATGTEKTPPRRRPSSARLASERPPRSHHAAASPSARATHDLRPIGRCRPVLHLF